MELCHQLSRELETREQRRRREFFKILCSALDQGWGASGIPKESLGSWNLHNRVLQRKEVYEGGCRLLCKSSYQVLAEGTVARTQDEIP